MEGPSGSLILYIRSDLDFMNWHTDPEKHSSGIVRPSILAAQAGRSRHLYVAVCSRSFPGRWTARRRDRYQAAATRELKPLRSTRHGEA